MDLPSFYQPQSPAQGVDYTQMARMLMNRQGQVPQGQAASPTGSALGGIGQMAGSVIPMLQQGGQMDANKAATALNGGVPTVGQMPAPFSRFGNAVGGMFGG